jgi:hypothetical protein
LDAGPIVIILTGLFAIFKFGLGDNENTDGISAYSVFNKGFQRLMGSVDVEALVAQHVGGGMAGFAQMPGGFDDGQADHRHVAAVARPRPRRPQVEEDGDDDDDDDNNQDDNGQANNENVARKSGKKSRRRNLEQRQEVKRQREAAMALGLQDDGGPEDVVAIQRLIEEQIAAERAADN